MMPVRELAVNCLCFEVQVLCAEDVEGSDNEVVSFSILITNASIISPPYFVIKISCRFFFFFLLLLLLLLLLLSESCAGQTHVPTRSACSIYPSVTHWTVTKMVIIHPAAV